MKIDGVTKAQIRQLGRQLAQVLADSKENFGVESKQALVKIANRVSRVLAIEAIDCEDFEDRETLLLHGGRATMIIDRVDFADHSEISPYLAWLIEYFSGVLIELGD